MDIQQRIADILRQHFFVVDWYGERCGCKSWRGTILDWYTHLAEILVAELGLTREERGKVIPWGMATPKFPPSSRYVTEWVPDAP